MIIWLASYPKSGNTWVRSFIISLLYSKDGSSNLKDLEKIPQFPMKSHFKEIVNDLSNIHELKKKWLEAQSILNLDNKIKFFKTHHLNCRIDNFNFTDVNNTGGVIHIVRDPRNIVTSIKNHFHLNTIEDAKDFILSENNWTGFKNADKEKDTAIPTLISSWKNHFNSWKKFNKKYLLIKYENLVNKPLEEFSKISKYLENLLEIKIDSQKLQLAIDTNKFENLRAQEQNGNFFESVIDKNKKKKNFFHLGQKNDFNVLLSSNIKKILEDNFKIEMQELGYK